MRTFLLMASLLFAVGTVKLQAQEQVQVDTVLEKLQEQSEKISMLEKQVKDLLKRNDLTVTRLEETFQTVFCLLGEIKWLVNSERPTKIKG